MCEHIHVYCTLHIFGEDSRNCRGSTAARNSHSHLTPTVMFPGQAYPSRWRVASAVSCSCGRVAVADTPRAAAGDAEMAAAAAGGSCTAGVCAEAGGGVLMLGAILRPTEVRKYFWRAPMSAGRTRNGGTWKHRHKCALKTL